MNVATLSTGLFALLLALVPLATAAGAKGSLDYRSPNVEVKVDPVHAYLFTVPDEYAAGEIARRVLLSTTDVRAAIDACETAECAIDAISDGVVVELNETPMVRWWAKLRGGLIQLSDRTDR